MRQRTVLEVAFRLQYDVRDVFADRLHQLDIDLVPMQMRALRAIWSADAVTSQHIVGTLKRDKAQVTRLVNELVARNLVYREPNPEDKRSKLLKLTDEGGAIFRQIEDIEKVVFDEMVQGIDEADLETFFRVADQLSENMRQIK
ncbi:MarR family winged helix-turn-helix transcriptional regulator [Candidatus Leptofilum sp.]|uniref:MarR family winged helix-turn-helix transcriptional regulator n=1 Tax=Candidatus Leptofilum sp. TaxID=3241576 RepID=UPI003B58F955